MTVRWADNSPWTSECQKHCWRCISIKCIQFWVLAGKKTWTLHMSWLWEVVPRDQPGLYKLKLKKTMTVFLTEKNQTLFYLKGFFVHLVGFGFVLNNNPQAINAPQLRCKPSFWKGTQTQDCSPGAHWGKVCIYHYSIWWQEKHEKNGRSISYSPPLPSRLH